MIVLDVLHDVSVLHPFRDGDKFSCPYAPLNPSKFQDIRVGKGIPKNNFSTKLLEEGGQDRDPGDGEDISSPFLSPRCCPVL